MNWRSKTEKILEKMGEVITTHPKKIITFIVALSFVFISQIPKITMDTSIEGFLDEGDPALVEYAEFKKQFGQDEVMMLVVRTKNVFDMDFLEKLKKIQAEIEDNVPHINEVQTLLNARNTRGEGDKLIVDDLFKQWPTNAAELEAIKQRAITGEMYQDLLLNETYTLTTIIIEPTTYEVDESEDALDGFGDDSIGEDAEDQAFLSDKSKAEMIHAADAIAAKYSGENFEIFSAGSLAVNDYIKESMRADMKKFIRIVILIMAIFLFIVFRRVSGVLLPIFVVGLSLAAIIGMMAITGTPITVPTQILPSFLLAVGIGATVHILAIFFKDYNKNHDKNKAIIGALEHSGLPIIMTSLTTAAGLLSFSTAEIAPVKDLGIFAASGVMLALFNTLVLLPALLSILPIKPAQEKQLQRSGKMDSVLEWFARFSLSNAKSIVFATFIIFVVFIYFITQIEFKHDPLSWHPEDSPVRVSTETVDKELKGSVTMEVVIDTHKENGLYSSEFLHKIDSFKMKAEAINKGEYFVGKAWSVTEVLKEIHRALHENKEEYYRVTKNSALIPQEFLLFENSGSDDLEDLVDSQFSKARLTIKLPWLEASKYDVLYNELEKLLEEELGNDVSVVITGTVPIFKRTLVAASASMVKSYIIAFVLITIMMILLLGSIKIGLVSMIPNVLPVTMSLGLMGMVGMPLDMFTMLVGAIVIGLSVDDTVHFFHNYMRYQHKGYSVKDSVRETMLGTGRAMIATTIVLALGFYVYMFASLSNLINFGILAGSAIIVALLSDIVLAPALLKLLSKEK